MIKTALRDYQEEAVERAMEHDGFLLIPEQRTGKCLISIAIMDRRKPRAVLIACPINAIRVWSEQIDEHLEADWPCTVRIANFEEIVAKREQYTKWLRKWGKENVLLIVDEAHKIKTRGNKISQVLRRFGRMYAKYKLALTGTPIAQGIQDAWALMNLVDRKLLGPFSDVVDKETDELIETGFETTYLRYGGFKKKKVIGHRNRDQFDKLFHSRSFRVTLNEARPTSLQERSVRKYVKLAATPRRIHDELLEELKSVVNEKKVKVPLMLSAMIKCQQICGGFYLDNTDPEKPELIRVGGDKIVGLAEIFSERIAPSKNSKCVIVFRFLHEMEAVAEWLGLSETTYKFVRGGERFDGKFNVDVILLQIQSGVAVDMSAADHMVFFSWNYSFIDYEQTLSRIKSFHKKRVNYYYLIAEDSVEELMYESVVRKKDLATLVCDKYRWR